MSEPPRIRWQRVQAVFSAALEASPERRDALVEAECAGDADLQSEVTSLLAAHAVTGAVDRLARDLMKPPLGQVRQGAGIEPGGSIAHYVVLEPLGSGGMGVVCRARDERLHRVVALKLLPPHLASDEPSKRRFLVEARAAAALEHPNVCTVYEIGEADGQMFLAMPLYEGETLQARLARGPLPVGDAISITREIAAGLSAAHQRGIVHRDIKPSNIMLLPGGRLKILDFGVAKLEDVTLTATGTPVGTVAYMSPEQTRGEAVDARADIWALGVVLYEMITGRLPFTGENASAVAYAIVSRQPDPPSTLREHLPAALDGIVGTALAKLPERRFATAAALIDALDPARVSGRFPSTAAPLAETRVDDALSLTPSAERRRAAVLVTLMSDYAALLEQLEPDELEETVGVLRSAAVDAVRRHGGIVNQALGDEIVSLFGIPAGHEDDDLRAVRAALELHARVKQVRTPGIERTGTSLALQSGIHAGTLVAQRLREGPRRYAVSGVPAQAAARLAALAGRDDILVSGECERMVSPFVAMEPARSVEWQSDTPPMPTHRVLGDSGIHARLEAGDRASRTPFTGRAAELASLQSLVRDARGGEGRMVFVVGEAGVGKSRIIHELREQIGTSEMRVLVGRCRSYGGISPYLPVVEMLRDLLAGGTSGGGASVAQTVQQVRAIDESLGQFTPLYLHLLSLPSAEYPLPRHLDGEHLHAALLDAISALVMVAAGKAPILVLLEDWHWADDASTEVLLRLAEIIESLPVAIIATARPEAAVLGAFGHRATTVQLGPLDPSGTGLVMQALLGGNPVSRELVAQVHERTGGNPFFLEQVAMTLREEGAIVTDQGHAALKRDIEGLRLPDTVQAVIRARLDRLDGDAREVLRVASVIGREFSRGLLSAAVPREIDCGRALDRLRAAALIQQVRVVPEPAYRFRHVLTQEVAYGSLLEHQRKALHAAIGAAIEVDAGPRGEEHADALAHHYSQAGAWEPAIRFGRVAAERLRSLSQFANALTMFERMREWLLNTPDTPLRRDALADILLEQERLCETLGQRGRQQQIINELLALLAPHGASGRLAEAYLRQGDVLTLLKRFDAADRALNTVLRISREQGDAALERNALRSIGLLRWHQDRHEDALALAEEALRINRSIGDELAVAGDLCNIGNILRALGDYDRGLAVLEEAESMPVLQTNIAQMLTVLHNLGNVHRARGDTDQALVYLRRADEAARVHMMPIQRSFHVTTIAHIQLQEGRVEDALETYGQAVELSRRARHAEGLAQGLRLLGELQFGLERYGQAVPNLVEAAALFRQLEDHESEAQAWQRAAIGHEHLETWSEAEEAWTAARKLAQNLADRQAELDAIEGLGRTARRLGDADAAARRFHEALGIAVSLRLSPRQVALHNTLGILRWEQGQFNDALSHYEAGLRLCRASGDRPHEGLMLNSMGVTLAKLYRHEEARTVLEESIELNGTNGQPLLQAHALAALADVAARLGRLETACDCLERAAVLRRRLGDEAAERALLDQLAGLRVSPRDQN